MFFLSVINWRRFLLFGFIQFLLLILIAFALNVVTISAEKSTPWAPDKRVLGYPDNTFFTPFLLADQNRNVHAFGVQLVGDNQQWAIVYSQWSREKGWSTPNDILLIPSIDVQILGVFLDSSDTIHLAFLKGQASDDSIYYTKVDASKAGNASAWMSPVEVGIKAVSPGHGVIAGDKKGNLVILYNGKMDGNGIYAVTSVDTGYSWSKPVPVFLTYDNELMPFTINGYVGKSGKLHIVWNIIDAENQYASLYYGRMNFANTQWDKQPVLLEMRPDVDGFFGPETPVVVDNGKSVVIMYNGGNPYVNQPVSYGRPTLRVQTSSNNGESWGITTNPFPFLTGAYGDHSLVIDSNQNVHAVAFMRIDETVNGEYHIIEGLWHSELRNSVWSDPERLIVSVPPLNVRAVVSQGNVILAAWIEESITGNGLWYSYTVLDTPELPVVALPTLSERSSLMPTLSIPSPVITPIQESKPILLDQEFSAYSPAQPLIIGIVPVILLIVGTVIAVQLRGRRKD